MSNDAREKAIERLAAILCVADREEYAAEAEKVGREVFDIRGGEYRASWERQARGVLDTLSLVAVPPDLVDAVRAADAAYSQRYPNSLPSEGARCVGNDDVTDVEVDCNETRLALADAILAQLTETKGTT
jgi:hypothetical protein